MKFKLIITAIVIFFTIENAFSQMMLSARIQGKETKKERVGDTPVTITLNKKTYYNINKFDVIVSEKNQSPAYKRTIEITDSNGTSLYSADESSVNHGLFAIDLKEKIASHKIIKLQLLLNPADDRMMLPSKMIQLAEIHLK